MFEMGSGPPLVLIPGIQGRWEWMAATVRALARDFRVLTSSLPGDTGSVVDGRDGQGLEAQATLVDRLLDAARVPSATLVGVSFGGLVASYAAASRPTRVDSVVLASAPGPGWAPDSRGRLFIRHPRLLAPVLVATAPWRLWPEAAAARIGARDRAAFVIDEVWRVVRAPMRPALMGERLRVMASVDAGAWCDRIQAPTLVLTGEPALDRVVPVESTRRYASAIPGARVEVLPLTGHMGSVTRPEAFADVVAHFVRQASRGKDGKTA